MYGSGVGTSYGSLAIPAHPMECSSMANLQLLQQNRLGWKTTLGQPNVAQDLSPLGPTGMAGSMWSSSPMADGTMEVDVYGWCLRLWNGSSCIQTLFYMQLQNNLKSPEACNLATPMHERAHIGLQCHSCSELLGCTSEFFSGRRGVRKQSEELRWDCYTWNSWI